MQNSEVLSYKLVTTDTLYNHSIIIFFEENEKNSDLIKF